MKNLLTILALIIITSSTNDVLSQTSNSNTLKTFGTSGKAVYPPEGGKEAELYSYSGKGSLTHIVAVDGRFGIGAYYTHIVTSDEFEKYSRTGDYADIIVDLGKENGKFVFWRGSSYLPYWEPAKGEKVYADEIIPRSGDGSKTMPDKVNSFSVVKIIENSANKVVVHWRYLPVFGKGNPHSEVIPTNFVDEYFTFSPNGTVRRTIKQGTPEIDDWAD